MLLMVGYKVRVLPAYAGMIRERNPPEIYSGGAPRVCGDDPEDDLTPDQANKCSPRMRG